MINLLLFLLAIACFGAAAAWMAENPGMVTLTWFDYRIDTSVAIAGLLLLAAAFALAFLIIVVRKIIRMPAQFSERRSLKHYKKGLSEITYSVAALAASDVRAAEAHTRKAEKYLHKSPLILLLSAQIARSKGDDANTRVLLEKMLEHEETEYVAARYLSDSASKQQSFTRALALAKRAYDLSPKDPAAIGTIVALHVRLGEWQEALAAINKAYRKRSYASRPEMKRHKGLVHLKQALSQLEAGHAETALHQAKAAVSFMPGFAPATLILAQAYAALGNRLKAIKIILNAWQHSPHPQLEAELKTLIADETPERRRRFLDKLEGAMPEGTAWKCSSCGHATEQWDAYCPSCGAFDSLEWK